MRRTLAVLVAAALSLACGLTAHAEEPRSAQAGDGSVQVVRWEVELGGRRITLASPIGEMARITTDDGSVLGLVPVQNPAGSIAFKVLDLTPGRDGEERSKAVDEVQAVPGEAAFSKARTDFSLTLIPAERQAPAKAAQAAETPVLPLSDRLIRWILVQPDGREVLLTVREGEVARVGFEGRWYALAPLVTDRAAGKVSFRVYGLPESGGAGRPRLLEGFELPVGIEHAAVSVAGMRLRLEGVLEVPREDGMKSATAAALIGGGGEIMTACCVRCGETEACGCAVSMDCGDCCSYPCCVRKN